MGERRRKYLVKSWNDRTQSYDISSMWLDVNKEVGDAFWIKRKRYEIIKVFE